MIQVTQTRQTNLLEFDVVVRDANGETRHRVTMTRDNYRKLTDEAVSASRFIEAAFQFLLDREPKEAILARFDVSVISRYFPEFEAKMPSYLEAE